MRFQLKFCHVMGPFSRLCKGFEDIRRSILDEATPVPVNKQIKLVEQAMILFEQASNATPYWKSMNILKHLMEDIKKENNILKEKTKFLYKNDDKLFWKKIRSHKEDTYQSKDGNTGSFHTTSKEKLLKWAPPSNQNSSYRMSRKMRQ